MPRGSRWTKAESIALVDAFVHISEDAIVGVNQAADTLYLRIAAEAKRRYNGDWKREPLACKGRWHIISRQVQKFIALHLLVESVPKSGWSEDDYYKHAVIAYLQGEKPDLDLEGIDPDSLVFEYKEEWEILKDHEKWRTSLSKLEMKEKNKRNSSTTTESGEESDEIVVVERPTGMKKSKAILASTDKMESLMNHVMKRQKTEENSYALVTNMMTKMEEQAKAAIQAASANLHKINTTVAESTDKLTHSISHALTMKSMLRADISTMSLPMQQSIQMARDMAFQKAIQVEMAKYAQSDDQTTVTPTDGATG